MAALRPLLLFLLLSSAAPSLASSNRLAALGGETRLLFDTSNLFEYPASATEFPHLVAELFDDWGGVAYPVAPHHLVGLFFDRPTPRLSRLEAYLRRSESALLGRLEVRPWIDLFYDWSPAKTASFALSGQLAYDTSSQEGDEASASAAELRVGLRLGRPRGKRVDAVFGLSRIRMEERARGAFRRQTDGSGYQTGLRAALPLAPGAALLSSIDLERESYGLFPERRDFTLLHLTLGFNATPAPNVLILGGLLLDYQWTDADGPDGALREEIVWTAPGTILAGEVRIGSLVFRMGMRHENRLFRLKVDHRLEERDFDAALRTELGLGFEFGSLHLDGLLEKDFLRDGPYLLGGSPHGGGLFSRLSLVYLFAA